MTEEQTHRHPKASKLKQQHEMEQLVYITEVMRLNKQSTGSGSPQCVTTNLHRHLNQNLPGLQRVPIDFNGPDKY